MALPGALGALYDGAQRREAGGGGGGAEAASAGAAALVRIAGIVIGQGLLQMAQVCRVAFWNPLNRSRVNSGQRFNGRVR